MVFLDNNDRVCPRAVLLVMAALLFLPAWTLSYWQAWVFLAVFGASALAITLSRLSWNWRKAFLR